MWEPGPVLFVSQGPAGTGLAQSRHGCGEGAVLGAHCPADFTEEEGARPKKKLCNLSPKKSLVLLGLTGLQLPRVSLSLQRSLPTTSK